MSRSVQAVGRASAWSVLVLLGALCVTSCGGHATDDLAEVEAMVRDRFPDVPQVSTEVLAAWLSDETRHAPILLDVRADEEFEVSHLRDARLAPDEAAARRALQGVPKDAPIVAYCSVGYRSSQLAERLRADGYSNVSNLEGSIFQWANEGRPVYSHDAPATVVHPFDAEWGRLLEPSLRAPLP